MRFCKGKQKMKSVTYPPMPICVRGDGARGWAWGPRRGERTRELSYVDSNFNKFIFPGCQELYKVGTRLQSQEKIVEVTWERRQATLES